MSPFLLLFKNRARRTLLRIIAIALGALIVGILVNQFHNQGIRWNILLLSLPEFSGTSEWTAVSTDSAFFLFLQQEACFIDIRRQDEFEIDRIPGSISLPFFDYFENTDLMNGRDRESAYILYDFKRHSKSVRLVAKRLVKEGFRHIYVMQGGYIEWLDRKYPVEGGDT